MTNLGIMGGSFDPPHYAHLEMANRAMKAIPLDRISFVPAFSPPLKQNAVVASAGHRLKMLELATSHDVHWEVVTYELDQAREIPTIETVEYLRSRDQAGAFYLIIGGDQAAQFENWHQWESLLDLAKVAVFNRPSYTTSDILESVSIEFEMNLDTSSSEIRRKIKKGESVDNLIPPKVMDYIYKEGLYL